jgi:NAD(P)H-hydrate epimerase
MEVPYVNLEQARKLDELMVEHFKVPILSMMENAGYKIAEFFRMVLHTPKKILICIGKGNNGGDGLCAARHLLNFGYDVKIFLISENLDGEPKVHLEICKALGIEFVSDLRKELENCDVVLDCLIGYNLKGAPNEKFAKIIDLVNKSGKEIVSCDSPSGVDTDRGAIYDTYIKAKYVLFLSLPKQGCKDLAAEKYVADIGVPKELYGMIGVEARNYFKDEELLKI